MLKNVEKTKMHFKSLFIDMYTWKRNKDLNCENLVYYNYVHEELWNTVH